MTDSIVLGEVDWRGELVRVEATRFRVGKGLAVVAHVVETGESRLLAENVGYRDETPLGDAEFVLSDSYVAGVIDTVLLPTGRIERAGRTVTLEEREYEVLRLLPPLPVSRSW